MNVFEIDPLKDPRWNGLIEGNPRTSVFHRREWLQALQCAYDYEPIALSLCSPSSPLTNALVFCKIQSRITGKRIVSLPFSDHCEPLVENRDEAQVLITYIKSNMAQKKWKYAEIRPVTTEPWTAIMSPTSSAYYFHVLDLKRSEEQLFKSFHKDCIQRKIRRAERESIQYQEGTSDALLSQFYKLLVLTRRKHFLPPQPLKWFRSLISAFGKDLKIRVALKDDIPIASILTLSHKKTITYKYGCSDPMYNNMGATPFLFWRTMADAKSQGIEEFDLGRSEMNNPGLVTFKEHWGAARSTLHYRRYPSLSGAAEEQQWARWVVRRVVSTAPEASLIQLGNLLYRHIG